MLMCWFGQVMLNHDHIDHAKFYQQMRTYKRKLDALRVEFLRQKARELKEIDATLGVGDQVKLFLKTHVCRLGVAVREATPNRAVVTFSRPTPACPVPMVSERASE